MWTSRATWRRALRWNELFIKHTAPVQHQIAVGHGFDLPGRGTARAVRGGQLSIGLFLIPF